MPLPLLAAAGVLGGASLANSALNYFGSQGAASAQRRAQGKARTDLTAGYGEAKGYQKPLYDTGMGQYQNLSDRYSAGGFANPHMDAYKFDPQQVFQDPEYQASMRAGTEAINSGANANSMLFSGTNARDLQQFGQDTFGRRSDTLYNRGFNAQNTAFDQNARTNLADFNMGNTLAQPGIGAANNLTNLAQGQGQDLANNSLGTGQINAQGIQNQYGAIGQGLTDLGNIGADTFLGYGKPGVNQPSAGGGVNASGQSWEDQIDGMINKTPLGSLNRPRTRLS